MTKIKDLVEKYGDREINEDELEKLLIPEKVKTIYNLEKEDRYYCISDCGTATKINYYSTYTYRHLLEVGNIYLTQEDCENEIEYLKVKAELKRYASMCEEPVDWNDGQVKYHLYYDRINRELRISWNRTVVQCCIFFTDKSILDQAIKGIGEERIIKYYFGVKGEDK